MSYILDALRKSEAARAHGDAPSLLVPPLTRTRTWRGFAFALTAILAVNAVLIALWVAQPAWMTSAATPTRIATTESPDPDASRAANQLPPTVLIRDATEATAEVVPDESAPVVLEPEPAATVVSAAGILEISSHVYADDASLRAITMHGHRYREGDALTAGIRLQAITENGIVVEENGITKQIDVLQDWR